MGCLWACVSTTFITGHQWTPRSPSLSRLPAVSYIKQRQLSDWQQLVTELQQSQAAYNVSFEPCIFIFFLHCVSLWFFLMNMFTCKEPRFIMGDAVCLLVIIRIVSNGKIGCKKFHIPTPRPALVAHAFGQRVPTLLTLLVCLFPHSLQSTRTMAPVGMVSTLGWFSSPEVGIISLVAFLVLSITLLALCARCYRWGKQKVTLIWGVESCLFSSRIL